MKRNLVSWVRRVVKVTAETVETAREAAVKLSLVAPLGKLVLMAVVLACVLANGCNMPPPPRDSAFEQSEPTEAVLVLGVDISGSFLNQVFGPDGRAYGIALAAIQRYLDAYSGTDARIVLMSIGGERKDPLLWSGNPQAFRSEFASGDALKQFILTHSDGGGSRVYLSVAEALDYAMAAFPPDKTGKPRITAIILTDWENNIGGEEAARAVERSLAAFGRRGGTALGIYGLTTAGTREAVPMVQRSGIKRYKLTAGFDRSPDLPSWE